MEDISCCRHCNAQLSIKHITFQRFRQSTQRVAFQLQIASFRTSQYMRTLIPILQCATHTRFKRILQHTFFCVRCFRLSTHSILSAKSRCSQKTKFHQIKKSFTSHFISPAVKYTVRIILSISYDTHVCWHSKRRIYYFIMWQQAAALIRHMTHLSLRF